jgi:hypothetical protein
MVPRCQRLVLLTLWLFGVAGPAFAQAPVSDGIALPPPERVLDCVKRVTGLDAFFTMEKIERASLAEIDTPFSKAPMKDKTGIRVSFAPGKVKWDPPPRVAGDPYVRRFEVYLNAEANCVLAVTSQLAERPPELPVPIRDKADLHPVMSGVVSTSFPTSDPKITFIEALEVARERSLAHAFKAQEIDGYYLMLSSKPGPHDPTPLPLISGWTAMTPAPGPRPEEKPHAVWIIYMRGLPYFRMPDPFGGGGSRKPPRSGESRTQDFVDAMTGKWMHGGISSNSRLKDARD